MRARMFGVGIALLAGIAVCYLQCRVTRTEPAARSSSEAEPAHAQHRSQVVSLPPPRLAPIVQQSRATVERPTPVAVEDAGAGKPETAIERFAPVHDALEQAFSAESRDGAWRINAQRAAEDALSATLPPQSAISSIDCRATLCRIESTHVGEAQVRTFVNQLASVDHRPWNGAFYAGPLSQDPQTGAVTLVTYFAREGAQMPAIPEPAGDEAMH